ncbi:MAG: hypothetical protein AAF694_31380 [Bacteroidota bacterium]
MPITYDINKDYLYNKGIEDGEIRGEERANRAKENQVISQGIQKGFSSEVLADLTGLSIKEVEARMKELSLSR